VKDLLQSLKVEFQDEDYRYAYAQSFLNAKLASQIKTLREQRGMTQAQVAAEMDIKQPGYRRFEDANHSVWKTDSLWNVARALGVRLDIGFRTFGTLPEEKTRLNAESLKLPRFEDDPAFTENTGTVSPRMKMTALSGLSSRYLSYEPPNAIGPQRTSLPTELWNFTFSWPDSEGANAKSDPGTRTPSINPVVEAAQPKTQRGIHLAIDNRRQLEPMNQQVGDAA
jgi:transcriptional regulator with XRE-family HTH domain